MNINADRFLDSLALPMRSMPAKAKLAGVDVPTAAKSEVASIKGEDFACHKPAVNAPADIETVTKAWGKDGSAFDVDGSGKVDVADLQAMVVGWSDAADAEVVPGPTQGSQATGVSSNVINSIQSLAQIVANWGQPDTSYDLNSDGTVNVQDLLQAIAALNQQVSGATASGETTAGSLASSNVAASDIAATTTVAPTIAPTIAADTASVEAPAVPPEGTSGPALTGPMGVTSIADLVANWGQAGSTYDINGDGTVNTADLLQLINQIGGQFGGANVAAPTSPNESDNAKSELALARAEKAERKEALSEDRLKRLGEKFLDRLAQSGFGDVPPTNIRDLVEKLDLSATDSRRMMSMLGERYPQGLGVNLQA